MEWKSWGDLTKCSKSCGDGVQIRSRVCGGGGGGGGGGGCIGKAVEERACSLKPCEGKGIIICKPTKLYHKIIFFFVLKEWELVKGMIYSLSIQYYPLYPFWYVSMTKK